MSKMNSKNLVNRKVQSHANLRLKKVTALMLASAVLSAVSLNASAQASGSQALSSNLSGDINGQLGAGYLITGDSRFNGSANVTIGNGTTQSIVHNFNTVGGAGSGGGAALGGAFFVDAGASLTLINTSLVSNRAQGGNGGSAAPVSYTDQLLNITGAKVDLDVLPVTQPDFAKVDGVVVSNTQNGQLLGGLQRVVNSDNTISYQIKSLAVSSDTASLLASGSAATFSNYGGASTTIGSISSGVVTFTAPVTASATSFGSYVAPPANIRDTNNVLQPNTLGVGGSSGVSVNGGTVAFNYAFNAATFNKPDPNNPNVMIQVTGKTAVDIAGATTINQGDKVFITVNGTSIAATVLDVVRYTDAEDAAANANNTLTGKAKALVLDQTLPTGASVSMDVIKAPLFSAVPFTVDSNNRNLVNTFSPANSSNKYVVGMTVTWQVNDQDVTAKVLAVSSSGQVTLDRAVPTGVTELKFVENPIVASDPTGNSVRITGAASTFKVGQLVYVPNANGSTFVATVSAVDANNNIVTVTPKVSGQKLADFYDASVGLALKVSAAQSVSQDLRTITVPFNTSAYSATDIQKLLNGRLITGSSFSDNTTVTGVTVNNNNTVSIRLSSAVSNTDGIVEAFRLTSPLTVGGSMNNIAIPTSISSQSRGDGSSGFSATALSSFFNDAAGVDGTNGKAAADNKGGQGFTGGTGGNGSAGLPVNTGLMYDFIAASIGLKMATRSQVVALDELEGAIEGVATAQLKVIAAATPPIVIGAAAGAPNPAEITAAAAGMKDALNEVRLKTKNQINAIFDVIFAVSDLVQATTNLAKWNAELFMGIQGLGGAGGDGGAASGGADFFGGGRGGAGGNGGAGALWLSDGGNGGAGGSGGGQGGFGAGSGASGDGQYGGGGSGLGGSIFVRDGGTLLVQGNSYFGRSYVAGGSTTSQFGEAGGAAGTDLFIMKGSNVRFQPGHGNVIQVDGTIADDSLATDGGFQNAAGYGADVRIGGSGGGNGGLVVFNGANTYSGHTILEGATLSATIGVGVNEASLIRFNGAGTLTPDLARNKVSSSLTLDTVGTFLLGEDYVRRAGLDPSETAWTGSGGFAAGTQQMTRVNLGALDDQGHGQALKWGSDGFFVSYDNNGSGSNGVLTFGSEVAKGSIQFMNNVDLNGNTGRVAVYNTGDFVSSNAILSGNWNNTSSTRSTLVVGDSSQGSHYNGTLFMTGQNSLDNLIVSGGTLSTYNPLDTNAGKLFNSTGNLWLLADKDNVGAVSRLHLFGEESLNNMYVLKGGELTLTQKVITTGDVSNQGHLAILGGSQFAALSDEARADILASLGLTYLPEGYSTSAWNGQLQVGGNFINQGSIDQYGALSAQSITNANGSNWNAHGSLSAGVDFVNTGAITVAKGDITAGGSVSNFGNLTLQNGNLTATQDINNAGLLSLEAGNLRAGNDFVNYALAQIAGTPSQTGNMTVGRDVKNYGLLGVDGDASVGRDLYNNGSLASSGLLEGLMSVVGRLSVTGNVLNAVDLNAGSLFVRGAMTNSGNVTVDGNTSVGAGLTNTGTATLGGTLNITAGGFTNSGTATVAGNTTVIGGLTNSGTASVGGVLNVTGAMTNSGTATVTGNTTVSSNLLNSGEMNVGGALNVAGAFTNGTLGSKLTVQGAASVGTDYSNSGTVTANGGLAVGGAFNNGGNTTVTGATAVGTNFSNNGTVTANGALTVTGALTNNGNTTVTGTTSVGSNFTNNGVATVTGNLNVGGYLLNTNALTLTGNTSVVGDVANTNNAMLSQNGDLTAAGRTVVNNGFWKLAGNSTISTGLLNGSGTYCLNNASSLACTDGAAKTLTLNLTSGYTSIFDGVFMGTGGLTKTGSGALLLSQNQTFSGPLLINGGMVVAEGTMNNNLDIVVGTDGTYVVGKADVIRSVRNNAPHSVILNADLTTTAGFENNGRLVIGRDYLDVSAPLTAVDRVLNTGTSGLTGSADGTVVVAENTKFHLVQGGNSTYAGQFVRSDANSALIKEGAGKLTASGLIDLKYVTITGGELALAKASILASDAIVNIGSQGTLSLLVGNQSINQLLGSGTLNLGSNTLTIDNGGTFNGQILGSGQVSVNQGTFNISVSVNTQGTFEVKAGSTTHLENGASLTAKQLDVRGTLEMGTSGSSTTVTATNGVDVYGTLKGGGTITGVTTIHTGANLKPGYSPGLMTFNSGLNLDTGSITTMEIKDPTLAAGTGYDQVVVANNSAFNITNGAQLKVNNYTMTAPLSLGTTVKLFNFTPGKVTGVFGQVTAEAGTGVGALSLATGNVVGIGAGSMSQIQATAQTDNERAIYSGLLKSTNGGVAQFYGGQFIEKLMKASAQGAVETKKVFNAYNPESYLSLSDVSQAATAEALPTWKTGYLKQERLVLFGGNTIKSTAYGDNHQVYGLGLQSLVIGGTRVVGDNTMIYTIGGVNSTVNSNYVTSTGNGYTAGLSLFGPMTVLPDTIWYTGLTHASMDLSGRRNFLSSAQFQFQGVNSTSSKIELGLEKRLKFDHSYVMMRGALALGTTNRSRVNETGSALDNMSVYANSYGYKLADLGLEVGSQVDVNTHWYGSLNYQAGNLNRNTVTAGYDNDQAQVTVAAKSALSSNGKVLTGLRHQYSSDVRIDFSLGLARSWDHKSDVMGRIELSKSL